MPCPHHPRLQTQLGAEEDPGPGQWPAIRSPRPRVLRLRDCLCHLPRGFFTHTSPHIPRCPDQAWARLPSLLFLSHSPTRSLLPKAQQELPPCLPFGLQQLRSRGPQGVGRPAGGQGQSKGAGGRPGAPRSSGGVVPASCTGTAACPAAPLLNASQKAQCSGTSGCDTVSREGAMAPGAAGGGDAPRI